MGQHGFFGDRNEGVWWHDRSVWTTPPQQCFAADELLVLTKLRLVLDEELIAINSGRDVLLELA